MRDISENVLYVFNINLSPKLEDEDPLLGEGTTSIPVNFINALNRKKFANLFVLSTFLVGGTVACCRDMWWRALVPHCTGPRHISLCISRHDRGRNNEQY